MTRSRSLSLRYCLISFLIWAGVFSVVISHVESQRACHRVERSLYERVFALAARRTQTPLPYAAIPRIELHGPKLSRKLTTKWYANRVNGRFERCLSAAHDTRGD